MMSFEHEALDYFNYFFALDKTWRKNVFQLLMVYSKMNSAAEQIKLLQNQLACTCMQKHIYIFKKKITARSYLINEMHFLKFIY